MARSASPAMTASKKEVYKVTLQPEQGPAVSYFVDATCERTAASQAITLSGHVEFPQHKIEVQLARNPPSHVRAGENDNAPRNGWIINVYSRDGRVLEKQFLVAVEDEAVAVAKVTHRVDQVLSVRIGVEVHYDHVLRRKMKPGDVFELGNQRIARGKNRPRD